MSAANAAVMDSVGSLIRSVARRVLGKRDGIGSQSDEDIASLNECGLFDREGYLRRYTDVAQAGLDPVEHYVTHGALEGRMPCDMFDTAYYINGNPDVAASGMNPFRHFCDFGWKEHRNPSPRFDMAHYVTTQMGDKAGLVNPLQHYASRETPYEFDGMTLSDAVGKMDDYKTIAESGVFDVEFYLASYPSVARAGVDPIRHYIDHGAAESRNPSPFFNTRHYLGNNPDVAKVGMNPLSHFCEHGWKELRSTSTSFDITRYWVMHMAREGDTSNPLVHYLALGRGAGLHAYRTDEQGPIERNRMAAVAEEILADEDAVTEVLQLLAVALSSIGRWNVAEQSLRRVTTRDWYDPEQHVALARSLAAQSKWWLVAESLTTALGLDPGQASWWFMLGDANERMNRFDAAVDAFRRAIALSPGLSDWHYRLGYACDRASIDATDAYAEALRLTSDKDAKRHGVGVFHQGRGLWKEARTAYASEALINPLDGGLRYRMGMACDRLYDWQGAAECYIAAIALSAKTRMPGWHFRLGFVFERLQRWTDAADAYSAAIALSEKHIPYWNYRLAYVLEKAGRLEEACAAWCKTREIGQLMPRAGFLLPDGKQVASPDAGATQRDVPSELARLAVYFARFSDAEWVQSAIEENATIADTHYRLGECLEYAGDLQGAAQSYEAALARSSEHHPTWFYRLGFVLSAAGQYSEACDAFRQTRILQRPHGLSEDGFRKNHDQLITTSYVEYHECLPVREDVILYESFNGNSVTCSPLAMFNALRADPAYSSHLHVWVLNDPERIPDDLKHANNVVFVSKASDGYLRYLATAKYLINNSGFPPYFVRKPGQKYLATWHGTPLKTLGKEQKYKFYDHKRTQRNFLQATHIITPNPHTTRITLDSYDIRPLYTGLFAETGYPRVDLTLNASEERKQWLRSRLGVSVDKPVVLYAPTWRGTLEEVQFDSDRLEHDLAELTRRDCQVLFRGHSLLERVIKDDHLRCQVVPADIDTNELLSVVDVLITDYSSIFFDFMATGRPILYYIYDVEEYEQERGLYFSMEEMPGFKCRTIDELCGALDQAIRMGAPEKDHYDNARETYNCHDDGGATNRVIDFFFNDSRDSVFEYRTSNRPAVIMAGGSFTPNGITTSFINLVNHMDRNKTDVVVAFAPNTVELSEDNIKQFRKLPRDIVAVPRYGNMPLTLEQRWLKKRDDAGHGLNHEAMNVLKQAYGREFVRIFGTKEFAAVISFGGYDAFWTAILTLNDFPMRKVIYLHNDMYSEYLARYPELGRMFQLYGISDRLISVSRQTHELNRQNLAERFALDEGKFDYCDNLSNPEEILERSTEPLERSADETLFDGDGPVFINVARLSVEKDHEKLIRAFSRFVGLHPTARLLILGSGPLEQYLLQVMSDLGVGEAVHLLGYRANPYPYLRRADCFVLSSNHEGQPMTLLEALVLDMPIIATDIVGNRSVLQGRPGLLVSNSVDGLVDGMTSFMDGMVPVGGFDWRAYQKSAVDMFNQRVLVGSPGVS